MKKILFISHDANRTGAPIVLMHHLNELKTNYPELDFDILLKNGGELAENFENISTTYSIKAPARLAKILHKIIAKDSYNQSIKKILSNKYCLFYGNTVVTSDILRLAKIFTPGAVTVCHVHELDIAIKQFAGKKNFADDVPFIDHFIVASNAVKELLLTTYKIPSTKIDLHYEHIPILDKDVYKDSKENNLISKHKGLKVCGSGTLDWRKGFDAFLHIAYSLSKKQPKENYHFFWIGGNKSSLEYEKAIYDMKKMNLLDHVTIIESCANPHLYISSCDIFLLTSREDPFPLVCLEAASLGKPIICFKNSGGMVEFVNEQNGWLVDYLDIEKVADLLQSLILDTNRKSILTEKGDTAHSNALDYDIKIGGKKLFFLIQSYLSS